MAEIPDFKIDLERSSYIKLRQYLLTNHEAPKLSHANQNLGTDLANLVFQHCDEALKEDFGLTRPLKGPGNDLWSSPSDLLLGKLALKPPFTPKCLQALTHKGILEIGYGLEKKFRGEMEMDKQRCLEAYKQELLASVDARMKSEIKDVEIRERVNCHMELEKQARELELNLKNELKSLEEKLQLEHENLLKNQETDLKEKWSDIMKDEVGKTVKQMQQEFLLKLDEQEDILTKNFSLELRKKEALKDFDAKMNKRRTMQALRQLKHNLECTNLVNMMYILCTERQKCCDEKERIEKYYKNEIQKLQKIIEKKDEKILSLENFKMEKTKEIETRETLLTEILKHFQKFINYALKSAPTQAEFLLSVEKMMVFELTNAVSNNEFLRLTDDNAVLTWQQQSRSSLSSSEKESSLEAKDFHNCYNELDPPENEGDFEGGGKAPPVVYFKDRRYIREEFRDLLLSGVDLQPNHELWSKDVQFLIDTWRQEQKDDSTSEQQKILKDEKVVGDAKFEDERKSQRSFRSSMYQKSNVQFKTVTTSELSSKTEIKRHSVCTEDKDSQKKLSFRKHSVLKTSTFPKITGDVDIVPERSPKACPSRLLGAKDSLEMIKEKSKTSAGPDKPKQKSKEDDEVLVEIIEDKETQDIDKDSEYDKLKTLKIFEKDVESIGRQASEEIILERPHAQSLSQSQQNLGMDARDSIILQKVSLMKKSSTVDFNASPVDSLEVARDLRQRSAEGIRSKSSKLTSARNSVTLLKESLAKLHEPSPMCIRRNRNMESNQSVVQNMSACCEKCKREGEFHSSPVTVLEEETKSERSVKISRIEVISLTEETRMRPRTNSAVSFQKEAIVYEPLSEQLDPQNVETSELLKSKKSFSSKSSRGSTSSKTQKPQPKRQNYYDAYPQATVQVLGDPNSMQGTQSVHEFTTERIHSLVNLMKQEPYLMQLFTACRR